ncbi:MAG: addiction module killer protein [Elusimicrobia bacterium RIFCSPLOWO2_01_FULL_54_10]|nr:MAG: addiction module killer protein [Elusimicrobia bacterium RIFCSPLOWO2_01_FULL_54_10]
MDGIAKSLKVYHTPDGRVPFQEWFEGLKDEKGKGIINARLARVRVGNLGDCKPVGEGVLELRISFGPGYRVYLGQDGQTIIIILCGGDKKSQKKDIQKAQMDWADYRRRQK